MGRLSLIILFLAAFVGVASAQTVAVINSTANPVNVTCVSGCSSAAVSSFSVVNVTTVTFNGVSQPVSVQNFPASQAVTGTFFQTTQPISGTVGVTNLFSGTTVYVVNPSTITGAVTLTQPAVIGATVTYNGTQVVGIVQPTVLGATVTFNGAQPVTGTFFPAIQSVSLTQPTVIGATVTYNGTQVVSIVQPTVIGATVTFNGTQNVQLQTGANIIGSISNTAFTETQGPAGTSAWKVDFSTGVLTTPPAISKGVQGSTGYTVQDLKDAGRTAVSFYVTASTTGATTAESALTLTKSAGTGSTSASNSFVVTSGKRFRILAINVATQGNATATLQSSIFSIRVNTAGSCITTSTPVIFKFRTATPATTLAWDRYSITLEDGYEILGDGTLQICASINSTFVTNAPTADMQIVGYEY